MRVGVYAAIVRNGGILVVEFRDGEGGHCQLPGGGVEPGETLRDAVCRQVREQTCAEVTVGPLLLVWEYAPQRHGGVYGGRHKLALIFRCSLRAADRPRLPERPDPDQVGVRWAPLDALVRARLQPRIAVPLRARLASSLDVDLFTEDV